MFYIHLPNAQFPNGLEKGNKLRIRDVTSHIHWYLFIHVYFIILYCIYDPFVCIQDVYLRAREIMTTFLLMCNGKWKYR